MEATTLESYINGRNNHFSSLNSKRIKSRNALIKTWLCGKKQNKETLISLIAKTSEEIKVVSKKFLKLDRMTQCTDTRVAVLPSKSNISKVITIEEREA